MKINRHGRAKILTPEEIQRLFWQGLTSARDRALFGVCLYTACRIREACTLRTADVYYDDVVLELEGGGDSPEETLRDRVSGEVEKLL